MLFWLLLGILVYQLSLLLPVIFLITRIGVHSYLLSRDHDPDPSILHARAQRIHRNYLESLAVFLTLGILAIVVDNGDQKTALVGAQMFVIGRIFYVPLYLFAVPYLRPIAWLIGFFGLLVMMAALI